MTPNQVGHLGFILLESILRHDFCRLPFSDGYDEIIFKSASEGCGIRKSRRKQEK